MHTDKYTKRDRERCIYRKKEKYKYKRERKKKEIKRKSAKWKKARECGK
jgi:hypothetical protein